MAKRRSWFSWIRKLFTCEAKAKPDKKPRRLRWVFRKMKLRQKPATAVVPTAQETRTTLDEAAEEQRKHALNVAIATAAAAEAAVAAAKAAAEVVRLAGNAFMSQHYSKKPDPNSAAIKIQSAFRAYLARKALRALKALVRLQAIVRGRSVRRRVSSELKSLPSSSKSQPEARVEDILTVGAVQRYTERKHWTKPRWEIKHELNLESSGQNGWDCSSLTKEDIKAIWLRKHEGMIKRERMLKYSRSHRERRTPNMIVESIYTKEIGVGMRSCRIEHWGESRTAKQMNSVLGSSQTRVPSKVKLKTLLGQDSIDGNDSAFSFPRRSFSRTDQKDPVEDDCCWVLKSETETAKRNIRSMSTPRQRVGFMDYWFDNK
ncbi:PREDICTED: uncharacterized protein LOC104823218 [Tarenaya hassleriana]|uniref:uncharacterized protein LOC104823218 n=1 Tax=Tarenaya hassleriana TaxID=28532 RepID=UPI00053C88F4|nr:PREDICTED: uncharacterized protein LOC104823218 [Tarenaya hassleriana]